MRGACVVTYAMTFVLLTAAGAFTDFPRDATTNPPALRRLKASVGVSLQDQRQGQDQPDICLLPFYLGVFAHKLCVGITISTMPLYLVSLGATPTQLGLCISAFAVAQVVGCPLLISLSGRVGRLTMIRLCLALNAAASIFTAAMRTWKHIAFTRILAGFFAASLPVAQAAATDVLQPGPPTSRALSHIGAASSLGLVAGPAVASLVAVVAARFRAQAQQVPKIVFCVSGAFALSMAALLHPKTAKTSKVNTHPNPPHALHIRAASTLPIRHASFRDSFRSANSCFAPIIGCLIALMTSWAGTLSNSTYALFSTQLLGYSQSHINASLSAGNAVAVCVQVWLLPHLYSRCSEVQVCSGGLVLLGFALCCSAIVRKQPEHVLLFLALRAGIIIADTTNAALTAGRAAPEHRARNLSILQSTSAAARIMAPPLAGYLYQRSAVLPYVVAGSVVLLISPLPLLISPLPLMLPPIHTKR